MEINTLTGTDDWLARDKIYHVIFCFSINVVVSLLASHSPYSFLRRRFIFLGSVISLAAGAAKEIADHFGFFQSAGASSRDVVADIIGVILAVVLLNVSKRRRKSKSSEDEVEGVEMVWSRIPRYIQVLCIYFFILLIISLVAFCFELEI